MRFPFSTRIQTVGAAAILSLVAAFVLIMVDDGTWLHPDTAQALSVARNLQQGNGFSTSVVYYEEHYQFDTAPAPQTVFPIGYPAMIAAIGAFGVPLRTAAYSIGVIGFVLVPPLICLAALRMGRKPITSFMVAAFWLCSPMLWHNVWERQTEMMFITLTLSSLILLQNSMLTTRRLLLSGLLAAIAFSLRYAGVFWLTSIGGVLLIQLVANGRLAVGPVFRQAVSFFTIPIVVAISLFARNAALVGDFKGGNNKEVHRTLLEASMNAWYGISRILGLDKSGLVAGNTVERVAVAGLAILVIAGLLCLLRIRKSEVRTTLLPTSFANTAMYLYIGVSVAALIGLEMRTSINLSPRMFFPVIPFALLAMSDVLSRMQLVLSTASAWPRRTLIAGVILLTIGVLSGQFRVAAEVQSYVHRFGMVNDILDQKVEPSADSKTARELLLGSTILSDESHMLAEALQQGTFGLTSTTYTSRIWTDDEVVRLIRKYHINRVVVFPDVQPKDANPFFESLTPLGHHAATSHLWLEPLVILPRIQIYAVPDSVLLTRQN
ncbi:MAG TPA: hypothetical protein PLR25_29100 [Planctomycetaceae bacterium]|nr:hypothetical protein [Planctomycetaceae bacterium]